jgi:type IV secretory pathway TraG/TraD family ATPase VirD4
VPLSLPLLRAIVSSAPRDPQEALSPTWQKSSDCWSMIQEAEEFTREADEDTRATVRECKQYFLQEFPDLHERTRSIVTLYFAMLVRPFVTKPLRALFSLDTTIAPEAAFDGKIIVVDLPVQEYRLVGRLANLAWKYCMQVAVMRRAAGPGGGPLRPCFIYADEAQQFVTPFDAEYQAVARSGGGCTVYLTQNRESYRRVLGDSDAVDSLLGNLQCKVFGQNSSVDTNEWAARLLGEQWEGVMSVSTGRQGVGPSSTGATRSEQRRFRVEPGDFTMLRRGGVNHGFKIDCIVYNGGRTFANGKSFRTLTFDQKR